MLQVGAPEEVYHRPRSTVVRDFLGKIFSLSGRILESGDKTVRVAVHGCAGGLTVPSPEAGSPDAFEVGQDVLVAIRPEKVTVWSSVPNGKKNLVQATLESIHFLGDRYEYTVKIGDQTRLLILPVAETRKAGEQIFLELKPEEITLWSSTA